SARSGERLRKGWRVAVIVCSIKHPLLRPHEARLRFRDQCGRAVDVSLTDQLNCEAIRSELTDHVPQPWHVFIQTTPGLLDGVGRVGPRDLNSAVSDLHVVVRDGFVVRSHGCLVFPPGADASRLAGSVATSPCPKTS